MAKKKNTIVSSLIYQWCSSNSWGIFPPKRCFTRLLLQVHRLHRLPQKLPPVLVTEISCRLRLACHGTSTDVEGLGISQKWCRCYREDQSRVLKEIRRMPTNWKRDGGTLMDCMGFGTASRKLGNNKPTCMVCPPPHSKPDTSTER